MNRPSLEVADLVRAAGRTFIERSRKWITRQRAKGTESLADLFEGRNQLVVYHFMFDPSWDEGCPSCSFWADNFAGAVPHLAQRDVTMIAISLAPLAKIDAFKARMGWAFTWVSSANTDFNADFGSGPATAPPPPSPSPVGAHR